MKIRLQNYRYLWILLLFFGCRQSESIQQEPPQNLLTRSQMANILVDLHLAEAMYNPGNEMNDSMIKISISKHQAIFEKYGVMDTTFRSSFEYYKLQPKEIDSIYTDVIQRLIDLQVQSLSGNKIPASVQADSISQNR